MSDSSSDVAALSPLTTSDAPLLSPPVMTGERGPAPFPHFPPAAAAVALLGPRGCRWPLGEPSKTGFAFCGAARLLRGSYCALHARSARVGARVGARVDSRANAGAGAGVETAHQAVRL